MYHKSRSLHKWFGVLASLFLLLIAVTGFFLATKSYVAWMRPPEVQATKIESAEEITSIDRVMESVIARGMPELQSIKDVDRIDYRPKSNIYKVLSKTGYWELQVDGTTAEVLSVAKRNDQWIEDLHDLSFFSEWANQGVLPVVAVALTLLAATGVGMFFTPVVRRWKFKKKMRERGPSP